MNEESLGKKSLLALAAEQDRRETAVELLARHLYFTMERLDPSEDAAWEGLTEVQRDFFRACIRELLLDRESVLAALAYRHSPATME